MALDTHAIQVDRPAASPTWRSRLAALAVSVLLGPTLVGLGCGLVAVLGLSLGGVPSAQNASAWGVLAIFGAFGLVFGGPALAAGLTLVIVSRRRAVISLRRCLAAVAPFSIAFVALASLRRIHQPSDLWFPLLFLALIVGAAALCWRLTRRWHSPAA
ncbi:hypothetical protein GCM10007036_40060 [Alsobacter metallidurans]|uniref:Uncharacterized protein n=1 Tax=Alsobacter metallidurans TaxID=340221 RepID=A0A917IA14_9HYPH|nr:hypothetical protein [Alsobacter metallidurans]GGH29842.1 hypothetical protein GCM10007036_40060 [Alsobacter metallidurans]